MLFSPATLGPLSLKNHLVMAPLTRNRAIGNLPNALMAQYYAQRAGAGLIITEGTSPSPNGLGYARIPGVFSAEQIAGWRVVADAVHAAGGTIVMQLMHCGRVSNTLNMPAGARVLAPSVVPAIGQIFTDAAGLQPHTAPQAMTEDDIAATVAEYARAATNAMAAGCDGVELHGANGYLIEQFIRSTSNQRTDRYGGPITHRVRFALEVIDAMTHAIGADRVGIRLSPLGVFNDMPLYNAMESEYTYLAHELSTRGLLYVHLVDHSSMGAPVVPVSMKATFKGTSSTALILSGGYDVARAEHDLETHRADLIAVGRPYLANPDLADRWEHGSAVNAPDMSTFYTPGPAGYTDYPPLT
ncbi:MAG: alkene reductase [Acidobacteria bacterium]|nr:alkene reductase [Acidobacteriota bacterium]